MIPALTPSRDMTGRAGVIQTAQTPAGPTKPAATLEIVARNVRFSPRDGNGTPGGRGQAGATGSEQPVEEVEDTNEPDI